MHKSFYFIIVLFLLFSMNLGCSKSKKTGQDVVDILVIGYVEHGPLQPSVRTVKEIAEKYGDQVKLTIMNSLTKEGEKTMKKYKLDAHFNILINGKYKYEINGKEVVFQWFVEQGWTGNDLDTVIKNQIDAAKKKK